jgi:hypothetical protein
MDEYVATIWFIDGAWRAVYEGADGRHYVIDGDGEMECGVWFFPRQADAKRHRQRPRATLKRPAIFGSGL